MLSRNKVIALIDAYEVTKKGPDGPKNHTALEHYLRTHSSCGYESAFRKGVLYYIGSRDHLETRTKITVMDDPAKEV